MHAAYQIRSLKELKSCQIFQIFLFLEPRISYNYLRKAIFQINLKRNYLGLSVSKLRKEGPKELLYERISVFDN